eukprot:Phypoly_transcript_00617.p1 GENE.Phypoly_transcript_00617~~Phypoly_transcript_00617.p1  ORF type:complete len:1440 (+),score=150.89 Phypoly_transcript_00617:1-4320(+)
MTTLCGGGPWELYTECFLQLSAMSAISLFLIVGGIYRFSQLSKVGSKSSEYFNKVQKLKILLCLLVAVSFLGIFLVKYFYVNKELWFHIVSDLRDFISWTFCVFVIWREFRIGAAHSWIVRAWWVLEYLGSALLLEIVILQPEELRHAFELHEAAARFALIGVITILGLWVKGEDSHSAYQKLLNKKDANSNFGYSSSRLFELEGVKNPLDSANIFSKMFFSWPSSLLAMGSKNALEISDLWGLPEQDTAEYCITKLEQNWEAQKLRKNPSLFKAVCVAHWRAIFLSGIGKLIQDAGIVASPIILNKLIQFFEPWDLPFYYGLYWTLILFVSFIVQSIAGNLSLFATTRTGNQIQSAITAIVYRKTMHINSTAKDEFSSGEILNYQSVDANIVALAIPQLHMIWSVPLQLAVVTYLLWYYMGLSMLAAIGVLVVIAPINIWVTWKMSGFQKSIMMFRDSRVRLMNELISGIRLVKFFNWETYFFKRVNDVRNSELGEHYKYAYARAILSFFFMGSGIMLTMALFAMYSLVGNVLDAEVAFTILALINVVRLSFNLLPMSVISLVEAKESLKRIQRFLLAEDMDYKGIGDPIDEDVTVQVVGGFFQWKKDSTTPTLQNINLNINRGELVAVVGPVGSGKSSLIAALLGEIHKVGGEVRVDRSVAYVPQQPWIQNASLRANILFGKRFDAKLYQNCVACCELTQDIDMLQSGDATEIGEKGINLSGGQKQRVSLARALYQNASVYLLDAPLSAVDAHVGNAIFDNMIKGALRKKTRIFVTHQLDLLPRVDRIIVMENGSIVQMGTYEELMNTGTNFAEFVMKLSQETKAETKTKPTPVTSAPKKIQNADRSEGKIIVAEGKQQGAVMWRVYLQFAKYMGIFATIFFIFVAFGESSTLFASLWWASRWTNAATLSNTDYFLMVFLILEFASLVFSFIKGFTVYTSALRAARKLHTAMVEKVLQSPLSFFDTTPVGRILNRVAKDTASVDAILPLTINTAVGTIFRLLGMLGIISLVTPQFLVPLVPISYLFFFLQKYCLSTTREVHRLDAVSKSPIYAQFSETLNGISTIRAFSVAQEFVYDNERKIDRNSRALFAVNAIARWFTFRMELICNLIVIVSTLACVLLRDNISPSLAGLSISTALSLTQTLFHFIKSTTDVETNVVSVERVMEYADLPIEKPYLVAEASVPPEWPNEGTIEFNNLSLRYRAGLEPVLSGVTMTLKPREKIGIVGRTGAGKSSLFLALLRLVEAESGFIFIDGENIATVNLSTLRSRLAIIPQDPTLFTGTVRSNLDPADAYSDSRIWSALESVHMKEAIEQFPEGIHSSVVENGGNFSVGQRQLLCLGRALLRNSKILLMDEATASVDMETDELIQQTIQSACKNMTVLTIAHRINTVLHSDRILVMDHGRVAELDTPKNLSANEDSLFYSLLQESRLGDMIIG